MQDVVQRLKKRWFLISLVIVFTIGMVGHKTLAPIPEMKNLRSGIVFVVLYLMALPLSLKALSSGIRRPAGALLSIVMNYGLLPLVALLVSMLITNEQVAKGLLVAAVTPCTLASASVWTRKAGGNDSVSIMVTLLTNLLCFLIAPLWLLFYFGSSEGVEAITMNAMVVKLGTLVVLPMALAQLTRIHRPTAQRSTDHKKYFSIAAQCGILSMVFMGAIKVAPELLKSGADERVMLLVMTVLSVVSVHSSVFWIGLWTGKALKLPREDYIAVGFAGSQKTLMVGLLICMELGVLVIPMVLYHVCQLFVDTLFADHLAEQTKALELASVEKTAEQ